METSLYQKCIDEGRFNPLSEWNAEKNGERTPDQVFPGSAKHVWWRCVDGHEWKTSINARMQSGSGCPVCAGRVGKKRLKRMQELEEAARASLAGRQLPLPERFIARKTYRSRATARSDTHQLQRLIQAKQSFHRGLAIPVEIDR